MYSNVWSSILFGALFCFLLLSPLVEKVIQNLEKSKTEEIHIENQKNHESR